MQQSTQYLRHIPLPVMRSCDAFPRPNDLRFHAHAPGNTVGMALEPREIGNG